MKNKHQFAIMKKILCLAAGLLALNAATGFGQTPPAPPNSVVLPPAAAGNVPPPTDNFRQRLNKIIEQTNPSQNSRAALTKFNLDFPGGTPKELVAAIEQAMGKPLNVIINKEDEKIMIPPLKMSDVFVPQLFTALEVASRQMQDVGVPGFNSYQHIQTSFGFKTADDISDTSVWYFHVEKPSLPPAVVTQKICQYYSLAPYLDRGFTVDDITTAIQTGWKMSGDAVTPELNYHKETKMLIAYGEPSKLQAVGQVLQTLPSASQDFWRQALDRMNKLQWQIDQLKQQSPTSTNPPAEKTGK
jgi:hypothetical protein